MNDTELVKYLLKHRNNAVVLYILDNTPSYVEELSKVMNTSTTDIIRIINFLRKQKLIKILNKSEDLNGRTREIYPLLLKKRKAIIKGLSPSKAEIALRKTKFLFSTKKGTDILKYINPKMLFKR